MSAHPRRLSGPLFVMALALAAGFVAGTAPRVALAAPTYVVNDPADTTAGKSCAVGSPTCTLRLAIQLANGSPGSTINVSSGLVIVFGTGNPQMDITAAMTIQTTAAGNATINGTAALLGVLRINTASPVTIAGLNISNATSVVGGGAIWVLAGSTATLNNLTLGGNKCIANIGGAIYNNGSLGLHNVTLQSNGTNCLFGGAIYSTGPLQIDGGSIAGNTALAGGGGIYVGAGVTSSLTITGTSIMNNTAGSSGGGVFAAANANLTRAHISGNTVTAGNGGGIVITTSTGTLTDSMIDGNHVTTGNGGGIYVNAATLTVTGTTVFANEVHGSGTNGLGGGLYATASTDSFTNSTIAGNGADNTGGAINTSASSINLNSVTVANNSAPGILIPVSAAVNLHDTILANTPSNCSGTATSQGYNIDTGNSCALAGTGDLPNTDPQLAAMATNGGPTLTMALPATSPAVDAGDPACPPPATDQRGVSRPQGSRCDIGAFELVPPASPPAPLPAPPATGRV